LEQLLLFLDLEHTIKVLAAMVVVLALLLRLVVANFDDDPSERQPQAVSESFREVGNQLPVVVGVRRNTSDPAPVLLRRPRPPAVPDHVCHCVGQIVVERRRRLSLLYETSPANVHPVGQNSSLLGTETVSQLPTAERELRLQLSLTREPFLAVLDVHNDVFGQTLAELRRQFRPFVSLYTTRQS